MVDKYMRDCMFYVPQFSFHMHVTLCNTHQSWSHMPQLLPYIRHTVNTHFCGGKKAVPGKVPCDQGLVVAHGGS